MMEKTDEHECTEWYEVWADHSLQLPYLLLLMPKERGATSIVIIDPKEGNRVVFGPTDYDEAKSWLSEDEYTQVDGRMMPD